MCNNTSDDERSRWIVMRYREEGRLTEAISPAATAADPVDTPTGGSARMRNRRRIVEAATMLWMDYPGASMDDVALRAGVARRTLYGHFTSREELVMEVARCATNALDRIAQPPDTSATPAASRLAAMIVHLWTHGTWLRQVWSMTDTVTDGLAEVRDHVAAAITAVLAQGQAEGQFSDHLSPEVLGDVVRYRVGSKALGLEADTYARVEAVNATHNRLAVVRG